MTSLVIAHGHNHQLLDNLEYNHTIFVDINNKCRPDITADVKRLPFRDFSFRSIMVVCCPFDEWCYMEEIDTVTEYGTIYSIYKCKGIKRETIEQFKRLLVKEGKLYIQCQ